MKRYRCLIKLEVLSFAILRALSNNIAQSISSRFCGSTSFAAPKIEKNSRHTCVGS